MSQILPYETRSTVPFVLMTDIHHHREADYLGRTIEIAELILHSPRLIADHTNLKPI